MAPIPPRGPWRAGGSKMAVSRCFLSGFPSESKEPPATILLGQYKHTPALSSIHLHLFQGGLELAQSVLLSLPPCHFNPLGQYFSGFFLPALVKQEHSRLIVGR